MVALEIQSLDKMVFNNRHMIFLLQFSVKSLNTCIHGFWFSLFLPYNKKYKYPFGFCKPVQKLTIFSLQNHSTHLHIHVLEGGQLNILHLL